MKKPAKDVSYCVYGGNLSFPWSRRRSIELAKKDKEEFDLKYSSCAPFKVVKRTEEEVK